jgi:hypothetical protein
MVRLQRMRTRLDSAARRRAGSTATLSDDDDDDDDGSTSFDTMRSFLPARAAEDESLISIHAEDETLMLGGGKDTDDDDMPPPPPRQRRSKRLPAFSAPPVSTATPGFNVLDPVQAKRFRTAPDTELDALVEEARRPETGDPLAKYATWVRRQVDLRTNLMTQSWYRQAAMVAAYAGIPITELVVIPSLQPPPRRRTTFVAEHDTSILNRLVSLEPPKVPPAASEDESSSIVSETLRARRAVFSDDGAASTPATKNTSPRPRIAPLPPKQVRVDVSGPTNAQFAASGASPEATAAFEAYMTFVRENFARVAAMTEAQRAALQAEMQARERTLTALMRAEERAAPRHRSMLEAASPELTGLVFDHPAYWANQKLARDMIRLQYPQTLAEASIESYVDSPSAASLFALVAAALFGRAYFVSYRRPSRASDYRRLDDGLSYAMRQFRFAVFDRRTRLVHIRFDDIGAFRDAAAARSRLCTSSLAYASTPYRRGGGGDFASSSSSSSSSSVRDLLLSGARVDPRTNAVMPFGGWRS